MGGVSAIAVRAVLAEACAPSDPAPGSGRPPRWGFVIMLRIMRALAILLLCLAAPIGCRTSASSLLGGVLSGSVTVPGGSFSQNQSFEPVGACCIPTGDCLTVTASDCANFSGLFFGEGIICGIAPCESAY